MQTDSKLPSAPPGSAPLGGCASVKRAKRKWWTITDDNQVKEVTGYSCAPHNPESWWCPEVGCTLHEKHHLWDNEQQALDRAIEKIKRSIQAQVEATQALVVRRHNDRS